MKKGLLVGLVFLVLVFSLVNAEVKTCSGDADGNGVIDKPDLDLFSGCYGKQGDFGDCAVFDYNEDGKIERDDFKQLSAKYGTKCSEVVGGGLKSSNSGLLTKIGGWFAGVGQWVGGLFGG